MASLCSVAVFGAPVAVADSTRCTGRITGTHDNVVVPPGATCAIVDANVNGNVKALENSRLGALRTTFGGNVVGDKAENVELFVSTMRGNVEVKEGESFDGLDVSVGLNTFMGGNVKIEKMTGRINVSGNTGVGNMQLVENPLEVFPGPGTVSLRVEGNEVAGNLKVVKNRSTSGDKFVQGNLVGGNLQCFDNDPPFFGFPNTVTGNTEGQCAQP